MCGGDAKYPATGEIFSGDLLRALHFTDESPVAGREESRRRRLPTSLMAGSGLEYRALALCPVFSPLGN